MEHCPETKFPGRARRCFSSDFKIVVRAFAIRWQIAGPARVGKCIARILASHREAQLCEAHLTGGSDSVEPTKMDREMQGGWVYMMADRYRGTIYVGVTADLAARVNQHGAGEGSDFCARYGLTRLVWADRFASIEEAITFEKRLKRWRREWKFELIEKTNPDWNDLFHHLAGT